VTTSPAARHSPAGPRGRALAERFFSPEEIERSRAYHRPLAPLVLASTAVSIAFLAAASFSPLGRWLAAPVDDLPRWAYALSYSAIVVAVGAVLRLPVSFRRGYVHEHRWGFSKQSVRAWLLDWVKGLAVQTVLLGVVLLGIVELAARLHGAWVWAAAPSAAAFVIFLTFLQPVVFEPIFNKFTPIDDAELATRIKELARRAGTPVRDVLVSDASKRSTKENAYVSGLGKTRRVVVFDTLLRRASPREIELIAAHELGHRKERHMVWLTGLGAVATVGALVLIWVLLRTHAVLDAIDAKGAADPRVIPFVLFVVDVIELLTMPFATTFSRRLEAAADRFGIRLTGDARGYAEMAKNLGTTNLADLTPSRAAYLMLFTHPSIPERIQAALDQSGPQPVTPGSTTA
jgi:STE24 endopeptidase